MLGLRRPPGLLLRRRPLPAPAALLHGPPAAALLRLLERWRARHSAARPPGPPQAGDAPLQALFGAPPFCQRRPDRFARRMPAWFPREAEGLSPATVALIAAYLARHRLRQPPVLDALAAFLLRRARQLDAKMIQKLIFPFSRTNYRPPNHPELFRRLESVLVQKAAAAPLATVNIVMSLVQLHHFPLALLHKVFSPGFLDNLTGSPCQFIMRRYLSLLDVAVALEAQDYHGPRLDPRYRVCLFDGALTADEANHKYSYKGLVAEALRQLVGEEGYRQNEVLPPGYRADFLLHISPLGSVLPQTSQSGAPLEVPDVQTFTVDRLGGSPWLGRPSAGRLFGPEAAPRCSFLALGTEPHQHLPEERRLLPAAPEASPRAVPGRTEKAEEIRRIVLSVNDKWHYCQSSAVLVGSRAMCNRHLRLLGYHLVQLPYMDLERVSSMEGAKQYLCQKLRQLQVQV